LGLSVEGGLSPAPDPAFRASGLKFRVSGFGSWVSGFGFRVSVFGSRVSCYGFRISGPVSRAPGSGFRVSGFGFTKGAERDASESRTDGPHQQNQPHLHPDFGFRFRVLKFEFRIRVSSPFGGGETRFPGFWVWGLGIRDSGWGLGFMVGITGVWVRTLSTILLQKKYPIKNGTTTKYFCYLDARTSFRS